MTELRHLPSQDSLSEAEQIPALLHCTNDAERIGDHTNNIAENILNN